MICTFGPDLPGCAVGSHAGLARPLVAPVLQADHALAGLWRGGGGDIQPIRSKLRSRQSEIRRGIFKEIELSRLS
jgi:hypothetical protein